MEQVLEKRITGDREEIDTKKWVHDSSVDHVGRIPVRGSTGVWKASLFIIAIEFSERLSYYGIATNLITYLTQIIHRDIKNAAKMVNYWAGVTTAMPLLGGFLADAYFGRFYMVLISSTIYLMGLGLLIMSQLIPSLKPCVTGICSKAPEAHKVAFFLAIYLISLGTGGHKPSLQSFGADQFDDNHLEERKKKLSYFNWWNSALCGGVLFSVTVIVYIQDNVGWVASYIILTVVMALTMVVFYIGKPFYRYKAAQGSPFTPMLQVLVAAIRKRNLSLSYPSDPAQLHEVSILGKNERRTLCHTKKLSFLDKAAILEENGENVSTEKQHSKWRLATVTQVEELKLVLNMVPIWLTCLVFGICLAQVQTFFIKQASSMNRNVVHGFKIPPASMFALTAIGMILSICTYDRVLVPILRRATGNERGITILQRIGIGMVFSMAAMVVAALVERKRVGIAEREFLQGGMNGIVSMSVFWLVPQFMINGIGDGFTLVGLQEFFYDQAPDGMRSLGIGLYLSVMGAADFLSGFLITLVDEITKSHRHSWFGKDLNHSRLDKFYCLLAVISGFNLCFYVLLAMRYSYKKVKMGTIHVDSNDANQ